MLRDRLDHWARERPDAIAMTFGDQTYTWEQWRERILRLTGSLRQAGLRHGDRLAVLDRNHLATVELTLAASSLGAATVVLNFRLSMDQIGYALEDSRPAIVVPAPGAVLDPAGIIAFCRERLAHYQCPVSVDFADELPRGASGKVLKRTLREPYWAGRERAI
jgi:acyl-CoA synthetase (AMP-forming)/AMP-acid ligase II